MARILTCKNHPSLRWSTKSQAVYKGKYTGARNIFFQGEINLPIRYYEDMSGIANCTYCAECECKSSELILSPEDKIINPSANEYNPESEEYTA